MAKKSGPSNLRRYAFTCPASIHDAAAELAEQFGLPLSNVITMLLTNWVAGRITIELHPDMVNPVRKEEQSSGDTPNFTP